MKIISSALHAVLDYLAAIAFIMLPSFLLRPGSVAAYFSYACGILQFLLSVCTKYRGGMIKVIPFRTHGNAELGAGIFFILAGLGFLSQGATNAFLYYAMAAAIYLIVYFLTDFYVTPSDKIVREL